MSAPPGAVRANEGCVFLLVGAGLCVEMQSVGSGSSAGRSAAGRAVAQSRNMIAAFHRASVGSFALRGPRLAAALCSI